MLHALHGCLDLTLEVFVFVTEDSVTTPRSYQPVVIGVSRAKRRLSALYSKRRIQALILGENQRSVLQSKNRYYALPSIADESPAISLLYSRESHHVTYDPIYP